MMKLAGLENGKRNDFMAKCKKKSAGFADFSMEELPLKANADSLASLLAKPLECRTTVEMSPPNSHLGFWCCDAQKGD
ncbi:MAG: hypothetical protein H8E24_01010 [Verrucomicrobia bacterium]|nr:hypothetical protein [Verrucomicrobiota bacterium]